MMGGSKSLRGRLAPSPTGAQHIGNARTYLVAWLSARLHGGDLVLRIENIDSPRVKDWAVDLAKEDISWLGLDWDGEILVQSNRLDNYQEALSTLLDQDLVYPCLCTRADVQQMASAPHGEGMELVYPGTCSWRKSSSSQDFTGQPHCLRFRTPRVDISFLDGFRGLETINPGAKGGDFPIWRVFPKGGSLPNSPAYQLAVVLDDAAQGVTEIIRGDDLVSSTPRQILLCNAFQFPIPAFTHVPLVVGTDGRRLAKRHGDTRLVALRDKGVKAEELIGLLAWSCGWLEKPTPIKAKELIPLFDLRTIPKVPFVLKPEMLMEIGYS